MSFARRLERRRAGVAVVWVALVLLVAAGCGDGGGSSAEPATTAGGDTAGATTFTPGAVEEMIRGSIEPSLADAYGAGTTMAVACEPSGGDIDLTCDTYVYPEGDKARKVRVIYGVTCDETTCSWQPRG